MTDRPGMHETRDGRRLEDSKPPAPDPRVVVAQIGARRHYAVPRALHAAGWLIRLLTDLHAGHPLIRGASRVLPRALWPRSLRRAVGRRVAGVPLDRIASLPGFAVFGRGGRSARDGRGGRLRHWARRNRAFGESVVRRGLGEATCAYAYNAAGLEVFRHARSRALRTVLDQTAAPWAWDEGLLARERERWPDWEGEHVRPEDWAELAERETEEWGLADVVVCGSDYVREAVSEAGGPGARCRVVPYACDVTRPVPPRAGRRGRDLRLLFVGTLELRKGVPYLLEAARRLPRGFHVRLVGPSALAPSAADAIRERLEWVGPVPRDEVREHYAWADVLVLPAVSEGSANVCYEALASGLPVVTTPRAGSIVRDGIDGRIVPACSADALAEAFEALARDPATLERMGREARRTAEAQTWADYVRRLGAAVAGTEVS